jgi:hypothetical protein
MTDREPREFETEPGVTDGASAPRADAEPPLVDGAVGSSLQRPGGAPPASRPGSGALDPWAAPYTPPRSAGPPPGRAASFGEPAGAGARPSSRPVTPTRAAGGDAPTGPTWVFDPPGAPPGGGRPPEGGPADGPRPGSGRGTIAAVALLAALLGAGIVVGALAIAGDLHSSGNATTVIAPTSAPNAAAPASS